MIVKQSAGKRIEGGVIATYILGKTEALAYVAGGALAVKLITEKPDVAQRYAKAWARAVKDVATDPKARDYLTKFQVPADMTSTIPLAKLTMLSEFKANDYADFQKFINFGVETGLVKGPIDVKTFVKSY
jgi:NitT/TauT family transport system substrate-binding protein